MNRQLKRAFYRATRESARYEQKSRCAYCRSEITARTATADHVLPRFAHGNDNRRNIVAACSYCNRAKGSSSKNAFIANIKNNKSFPYLMIWARRKINLRTERAIRNISRACGMREEA